MWGGFIAGLAGIRSTKNPQKFTDTRQKNNATSAEKQFSPTKLQFGKCSKSQIDSPPRPHRRGFLCPRPTILPPPGRWWIVSPPLGRRKTPAALNRRPGFRFGRGNTETRRFALGFAPETTRELCPAMVAASGASTPTQPQTARPSSDFFPFDTFLACLYAC